MCHTDIVESELQECFIIKIVNQIRDTIMRKREKYKFDLYEIYEKGRTYQVIVMPRMKYMFVFDGHPEGEKRLFVDGDKVAYKYLKLAYSILIKDPSKLIYFPCRWSENYGDYYHKNTSDYVLYRYELQFRRSRWYRIKDRLDRAHYKGKYVLDYERDKQLDWLKKQEATTDKSCRFHNRAWENQRYWDDHGTAFEQFTKEALYIYYESAQRGLSEITMGRVFSEMWLMPGCLYSDADIQYLYEELRVEAARQVKAEMNRGYELFREALRQREERVKTGIVDCCANSLY